MTDIPDNLKRKWQCFCCGVEFKEYETYRNHILDQHEEGREYILCPKCQAPIRDMKLHFKLKHPHVTMPAGLQHRTILWRDQSAGGKKKTQYKQGDYISKRTGKKLHYRSGLELKFYELLDQDMDVVAFYSEPISIPYYFKGKMKNYIPDLVIQFVDGHKEVWEIKPSCQTTLAINEAKWTYATKYCEERGLKFSVWTEKVGLGKLEKKIRDAKLNTKGSDDSFFKGGGDKPDEYEDCDIDDILE
jgi:hypothetical protein